MRIKNWNETQEQKRLIAMSKEEFDSWACASWPVQFAMRRAPMTETCMCWGFCIGRGWRPLLVELLESIECISSSPNCPATVRWEQIKEKYGSARFYFSTVAKEGVDPSTIREEEWDRWNLIFHTMVSSYEAETEWVCAETGKSYDRKVRMGGWIYDECAESIVARDPSLAEAVAEAVAREDLISKIRSGAHWMGLDVDALKEIYALMTKSATKVAS